MPHKTPTDVNREILSLLMYYSRLNYYAYVMLRYVTVVELRVMSSVYRKCL